MGGFPTEGALQFFLAGNENSRITGTARTQFARDSAAGDAFGGVDDFEDRKAAAVADVEGFARDAFNLLESAKVGIGDIEDVDVIADAGSVGRGVVRAEDIDVRQAAGGGVEDAGNKMSFDAMLLAAFPGGSGSVEIAKDDVVESGVELVIGEYLFEY
jgi:hypothetical protein